MFYNGLFLQVACTVKSTGKKKTLPVIVRLADINDNAPVFENTPYETSISELTPIGTPIFQNLLAKDKDAGVNALVEYSIVPGNDPNFIQSFNNAADGYGVFAINFPHQGQVTVNSSLDFEKTKKYFVTVVASDKAKNMEERLSSTTILTVNILDDDDQNPSFIYKGCMMLDGSCINPEYKAVVSSGVLNGILEVFPEKILAVDMDTINSPIKYSFVGGSPASYDNFFKIDSYKGTIHQIKAVDTSFAKEFDIIIKAEEVSQARRSTTAKLKISVKAVDAHPPEVHVTDEEGFVNESSPIGTRVLDKRGMPLIVSVIDKDLVSKSRVI